METLRCLIVDDEPPAIRLLENYLSKVSFLVCCGTTTNPLEAAVILDREQIQVLFLDIQIPELPRIQLSKIVHRHIRIIFTTAYPQFALESYELNAVDYLLKPFEFERFYQAVLKLRAIAPSEKTPTKDAYIFAKTDGKLHFEKVYIKDIWYIESLKNYVCIHQSNGQIVTHSTLKHMGTMLPEVHLIQIHKSYIVALGHIFKTDALSVYLPRKSLPIGDTYKQAFFDRIRKLGL